MMQVIDTLIFKALKRLSYHNVKRELQIKALETILDDRFVINSRMIDFRETFG